MSFVLNVAVPANPITGLVDGQTVNAYLGSRFSPVNVVPATNAAAPGGGVDYGPVTTPVGSAATGTNITVTQPAQFILSYYDPTDISYQGTYNVYWIGPFLPILNTTAQPWTAAADQVNNRVVPGTTVAAGSNGVVLPTTTINVVSTTGFATSGSLIVGTGIIGPYTTVTYTGVTGTAFTGCAGGSLTLATGMNVFQGYQNGNYRRLITATLFFVVAATGTTSQAYVSLFSQLGGNAIAKTSTIGFTGWNDATVSLESYSPFVLAVDPSGWYGVLPTAVSAGSSIDVNGWIEVDF